MRQLLCYGDSNTWGLIPGTEERYGWGVRWTSILQEKIGMEGVRVLEEGLCGRTTIYEDATRPGRNGVKELSMVLETHRPIDAAVIMLGTNDCKTIYGLSAEQIAESFAKCIEILLKELPSDRILAISPMHLGSRIGTEGFDPEFNAESVRTAERLKETYRTVCDRAGVAMISAADYVQTSPIDQEHMDDKGHAILAEAVYQAIKRLNIL